MKALQDINVTHERVINRLRKRNETLTNEHDQYKGALHMLNKEVTTLTKKLKEEARLREKAQEEKANLKVELTAICGQVETARADAIIEFKASQPFIDACVVYYSDGFEDCLKQVRFVYPNLDLSKVTMDDPLPTTPVSDDTVSEETDDSTQLEQNPKDDSVVLTQLAIKGLVAPLASSTNDPSLKDARNPSAQDAQNPPAKDDKNPPSQDTQNLLA